MCMFSGQVSSVANTRIFARSAAAGGQFLVYSMQYQAGTELAMILPLPTPPAAAEEAVRFIDLSGYAQFFDDMARGFILPQSRALSPGPAPAGKLKVHEVGSFQASFVPQQADFARLDSRFRLPERAWERLPQYDDYGFAVFKLQAGAKNIHPLAFEFPRRDPLELFFPTVHVHDGSVDTQAHFDHSLYCQVAEPQPGWLVSSDELSSETAPPIPAGQFMDIPRSLGIVEPQAFIQMKRLRGMHANEDVILPAGGPARA